ncbi:MAG: hypothetical protein KatS3mg102_2958 [Planctomycetota bacterium]|nr:MAG: hypothetical protein KatS3mg102_2958 [Planctomycetota bacterium]
MGGVRRRLAAGLALAAGLGLGMPGAWGQGAGVVVLPTERQEAIPIEADKGVELAPGDAVPGGCVVERLRQLVECLLDARSGACPEILKSCGFTEQTRPEETFGLLVGAYATRSPVVTLATQRVEAGLVTYDLRFEKAIEKDLFAAKVDRTATVQAPEFRQIRTIDSITARAADGVEAESKLQDETRLKVAQLLEEQAVERHPCLQEVRLNSVDAVDLRGKVVAEAPKLSFIATAIVPAPELNGVVSFELAFAEDGIYKLRRALFITFPNVWPRGELQGGGSRAWWKGGSSRGASPSLPPPALSVHSPKITRSRVALEDLLADPEAAPHRARERGSQGSRRRSLRASRCSGQRSGGASG